ncbi:MAG: transcriptional regulator NrdR [Candidatus Dormibacteria bacterium]
MKCPYCGADDLKVVDSRDSETGEAVRRRRECLGCAKRFTTYERIESVPFFVLKKDGRREDFDRQKLFSGLRKACEKRPISPEKLQQAADEIESELRHSGRLEIPGAEVGELVMGKLRQLDPVAYVRFASVYREFMDIDEFERVVKEVRGGGQRKSPGGTPG